MGVARMDIDVAYHAASEAAGELRSLSLGHRRTTTRQVNAVRRKLTAALSALQSTSLAPHLEVKSCGCIMDKGMAHIGPCPFAIEVQGGQP